MEDRTIQLPEKVGRIIGTLQEHGYEAYAVGGCIRDSILGREPEDWDITTSAMPEETKALFDKTFDTGIQHGTITVLLEKEGFEVTTYRIDGKYEDSRHPCLLYTSFRSSTCMKSSGRYIPTAILSLRSIFQDNL